MKKLDRRLASILADLEARGFDQCQKSTRSVRVQCSQCQALAINGVACHERNCPNQTKECKGCDARIPARAYAYCEQCQEDEVSRQEDRIEDGLARWAETGSTRR